MRRSMPMIECVSRSRVFFVCSGAFCMLTAGFGMSRTCAATTMSAAPACLSKRRRANTPSKVADERATLIQRLDRAALERIVLHSTLTIDRIRAELPAAKQSMEIAVASANAKPLREGDTGSFSKLSAEIQVCAADRRAASWQLCEIGMRMQAAGSTGTWRVHII